MKRWALLLAVVGIAACTWIGCAGPTEADKVGGPGNALGDKSDVGDAEVLRKLQTVVKEANFSDRPLAEFADWLRTTTGLNVYFKWTSLETAGITQQTKIKQVRLKEVTVEKVLRTVLDDIGATSPLEYVADEGSLGISTREDLSGLRHRKTVIYDIRDLIPSPPPAEKEDYANNLRRTITQNVDKDSWMDPDGTGQVGSINYYGGLLIIMQTPSNHAAIAALLADIRRHRPTFK